MSVITIEEIMPLLPHRYPFLLVDRVLEIEPGERIVALKNVTFNEPFFPGHFPGRPIMPGVMIIEAMAQASAIMVGKTFGDKHDKLVYFMSIDSAKFRKPVTPGDSMELHVTKVQNRGAVWKCTGQAIVAGQKVAEADFSAMIVDKKDA